jgi:hypothetical protein
MSNFDNGTDLWEKILIYIHDHDNNLLKVSNYIDYR